MTREENTRQLLRAAAAQMPTTQPPLETLIRDGRTAKRRRGASLVVTAAAAVAVIALGAFLVAPTLSSTQDAAADSPATVPPAPSPPPGTRLVGFQGVAVAVPDDWGINRIRAGGCQEPVEDTVVFPRRKLVMHGTACGRPARSSSLHLLDVGTEDMSSLMEDARPAGRVDGAQIFTTSLRPRQLCDGEPCSPHQLNQALIVPSKDVLMYVNSPQKATIESVLGSVRLIPAGYTAVPDLSGLMADGDNLERLVEEAGLGWERTCPDDAVCYMGAVEATDPAAGSVVAVGTSVTVAEPPSPRSTPPVSAGGTRLVGMGRVVVTVPQGWGSEIGGCVDLPVRNTIYFPAELMATCAGTRPPNTSSVRFYDSTSPSIERLVSQAQPAGRINGVPVSRIPTRLRATGITEGVLVVPGESLLVWVDSPTPSIVNEVVESVSLLPDGFVAIPTAEGPWQSTQRTMIDVGLAVEVVEQPAQERSAGRLLETRPTVGSVVRVGSTVSIVVSNGKPARPGVGDSEPHKVTLYHCGVAPTAYQGRMWKVRPGFPDERHTAPSTSFAGTGTMTRLRADVAEYVDKDGTVIPFVPDDPRETCD